MKISEGGRAAYLLFYYDDVTAAARWYRDLIGLEMARDLGESVILRLTDTSYLGLIDHRRGTQRPVQGANKGVILSIEEPALEERLALLVRSGAADPATRIEPGIGAFTEEFKLRDPEGHTVEFFRWIAHPAPAPD